MAEGTKERILRIALELFAQNGYLGTSMNDIARQAGLRKPPYISTMPANKKSWIRSWSE